MSKKHSVLQKAKFWPNNASEGKYFICHYRAK
jgi:hypothetical protein